MKKINEIIDYIEYNLMDDIEREIKIYPKEDLEHVFNYVIYQNKEIRDDFLFYIIFTPYTDFILKVIDSYIGKYPLEGYELKKATFYLDINPNKTLEICNNIEIKYKNKKKILEKIEHLKEWVYKNNN